MLHLRKRDTVNTGAILLNNEIRRAVKHGEIRIQPFDKASVGANSYDIHISNKIATYNLTHFCIDPRDKETYTITEETIPDNGTILYPNTLYLVSTMEKFGSDTYVPIVTGRSSIGRMGIAIHREAGFGDIGYYGSWTLQLTVMYPTMIYPNMRIGQVYFLTPNGNTALKQYTGKYGNGTDSIQASRFYKDLV